MVDKLCVAERRSKMLNLLVLKKHITIKELRDIFRVSKNTIVRDIVFISSIAPIYTKQGNGGGIYILPEYRSYKNYFTDYEEKCLYRLTDKVDDKDKSILFGILMKFSKNPLPEYSAFQNLY